MKKHLLTELKSIRTKGMGVLISKSGASMLFVMAAALILLIVGASTLVAAGANAGAGVNRQIKEQLNLYAESLQSSILKSLQDGTDDVDKEVDSAASLGGQILKTLYEKNKRSEADEPQYYTSTVPVKIDITPRLEGIDEAVYKDVVVHIDPLVTIKKNYTQQDTVFNNDGTIKEVVDITYPREVIISGEVSVTVFAKYREKTIQSVVTYNLTGALLSNPQSPDGAVDLNKIIISDAGDWGFVSHEKIDK